MTPFLEIAGLSRHFGSFVAVRDVNLTIRKGEFMTFLGPSGSGKSTTLYALAGLDTPTSGDITIDGRSILDVPPHRRNIGMVFQRYTLFPHLTVAENVGFPLSVRRRPAAEIAAKVARMLELVRLQDFAQRKPAQLSGGQQQRVALARALVYEPPVLLMDEPLAALDKKLREEIQFEIRRIHQETGVTILYVTHDQEEALRLSDRIAVFSKGVIDQIGTGAELYENPATRFVAEFIGDSDFLPCEILASRGGMATVGLSGGLAVDGVPLHGSSAAGRAELMLRPERISLSRAMPASGPALPAVIGDLTFLGSHLQVATATADGRSLSIRLPFGHETVGSLARGDDVWFSFRPADARVFCSTPGGP
jgi:putative spermidine/putrescine transport system ATP-binding protein